jgi:RNase H-like domain found in reverse transcriptase/Integrase zinc binding domain/Reverse transcriptase (RNA-dependent DNA polymerase)
MFFGMCNFPATFQAMMDKIFKKEIEEDLIIVYMDDILAFSKTIDGLKKIKWIILEKAWEYDLYLKAKKCKFRKPKIEYLGLVVEEGKLAMDPAKLKEILDWPAPKTVKEVRSFIGFGNFYHCFVKGFFHLAHPLHDLLKKDKKFVWSEECQESFNQLKKQCTEEPVLMMPDHSKPFQIQVDSSLFATGGILIQIDTNGARHPCAYLSKSLTKEQRNYDTGDRELLAIIWALKEWRHYIQGSGHTTMVLSDHDNLWHFKVPQTIGWQMAQWTLYLSEFNIKLIHIPEKKNIQANSLSRRPDLCPPGTDNKDVIVLPEHLIVNLIDMELQKKIANTKNMDYDAAEAIEKLLEQGPREAKKDLTDLEVEEFEGENILFNKGKNYVPIDAELQREIVWRYHNHLTAGHPGELQTFNAVKKHYWWPGLWVFIENYVQGCGTCQQFKINRNLTKPAFMPLKGAKSTWPFAGCSMDLITDLPPVNDCDSILVMVDRGNTKGAIFIPTAKTLTQEGAGQLLLDNLYKQFGLPNKMLSDRGPQFAAKVFRKLLKLLGIKSNLTTAYYPQTDGATERVNQEIEAYLLVYCSAHPTKWKNSLSTLEFSHNNWQDADQIHTSLKLMNGKAPVAIPTTFENTKFPSVAEKIKNLVTSREEALAAHELAKSRMVERIKSKFVPFKKGQMVWLDLRHLKTNYHKKMALKREGPFEIEEVLGLVTYQLKLPESWQIHKVFHAAFLCPYRENEDLKKIISDHCQT